jgi:hypothetical protein
MNESNASERGKVRLTLEVNYSLKGDTVENMRDVLQSAVQGAIGEGLLLKGSALSEVESFSVNAEVASGPRKVFVATYEHRHGDDQRVFTTEAQAQEWKNALADEYWEEELSDEPLPKDLATIGDAYFDAMGDASRPEYFRIEAHELETG